MKLVILGKGGQGVLFFSKIIAQVAMNRSLSVYATEIKGMAKKGGVVEVQMKIGEGKIGVLKRGDADLVILLSQDLKDYALTFGGKIFSFSDNDVQKALETVSMKYVNTFLLGVFVMREKFFTCEEFLKVLDGENQKSFMEGCRYVQSQS
ncbi:MAG: 2-oxoacid:acceptor oxidoreductase family protein [Caldimicrobium sp.]